MHDPRGRTQEPLDALLGVAVLQAQVHLHALHEGAHLELIRVVQSSEDHFTESSRDLVVTPAKMAKQCSYARRLLSVLQRDVEEFFEAFLEKEDGAQIFDGHEDTSIRSLVLLKEEWRHVGSLQLEANFVLRGLILIWDAKQVDDEGLASGKRAHREHQLFERRRRVLHLAVVAASQIHQPVDQVCLHEVGSSGLAAILDHLVEEVEERTNLVPELVGL